MDNWGLWDLENIRVDYLSDTWVQVSCKHLVVNGDIKIKNIRLNFFDKVRGVNFEEKVKREFISFVLKINKQNEKIIRLRKLSQKAEESVKIHETY